MKTRLLLFMALLSSALSFAQFNVFEGFESGTTPIGWTQITGFYTFNNGAPCNGQKSALAFLDGSNTYATASTPAYTSNGNQINVSYNYKRTVGLFTGTIRMYYDINSSNSWTEITNSTTFSTDCTALNGVIASGVVPSASNVRFRIQANRNTGDTSVIFDDFSAVQLSNASITNVIKSPNMTTATVACIINPDGLSTTSVLKYGTVSTSLTNQVTATAITTTSPRSYFITGLTPNTQYFFEIEATSTAGVVTSSGGFSTGDPTPQTIAEYNFDGTYNNLNGNMPFTANTGTSFTTDRNGNALSALNLVDIGTTATIPNLPYDSTPRTISIWVKNYAYNWFVASAFPFSYGSSTNAYELAMYQNQFTINPYGIYSGQHIFIITDSNNYNALNAWNHYVVSYNGTTSKIYKDGALLSTLNVTHDAVYNNGDIFKLGLLSANGATQYFNGAIDDLKIYNYALTDAQVTSLFNSNTLTSQNFNQNNLEVSLYPNPANDVLNIEMTNEVQSIEIYNIQGQKVKAANQKQINIADLANGMYMIKIQDAENAIATKKFMKQ